MARTPTILPAGTHKRTPAGRYYTIPYDTASGDFPGRSSSPREPFYRTSSEPSIGSSSHFLDVVQQRFQHLHFGPMVASSQQGSITSLENGVHIAKGGELSFACL